MIFLYYDNTFIETKINAIGCFMHCPFSYVLHIHRSMYDDNKLRKIIYKFDVSFIHIHSLLSGYSWQLKFNNCELIYHILCIINITQSNVTSNNKQIINILCGIGVVKSSHGLFYRSNYLWYTAMFVWIIGFVIYLTNCCKKYSSTIFHILLTIPQLCIMYGTILPLF